MREVCNSLGGSSFVMIQASVQQPTLAETRSGINAFTDTAAFTGRLLRKIIFHLRRAIKFFICSRFGVGLISRPFFPLRLEFLNILPKHPRRHALDGERLLA